MQGTTRDPIGFPLESSFARTLQCVRQPLGSEILRFFQFHIKASPYNINQTMAAAFRYDSTFEALTLCPELWMQQVEFT